MRTSPIRKFFNLCVYVVAFVLIFTVADRAVDQITKAEKAVQNIGSR